MSDISYDRKMDLQTEIYLHVNIWENKIYFYFNLNVTLMLPCSTFSQKCQRMNLKGIVKNVKT